MSEISETEIKKLTKVQNYFRGYFDGKSDVLDKIRAEIDNINLNEVATKYEDRFYGFQREVIKIIDKYKAEGEEV